MAEFTDPNVDPNSAAAQIPMQVKPLQPNPMGAMQNAYTLADLVQRQSILHNAAQTAGYEAQDTQATRQAVAANTTQDPQTGQVAVDQAGTLRDLMKVSPTAALNWQMSIQQRQAELAEKKQQLDQTSLANNLSRVNLVGQLVQHVNSQSDLDNLNASVTSNPSMYGGLTPGSIPKTFDPQQRDQLVDQAVSASNMLNNKIELGRLQLQGTKQTADIQQQNSGAVNEVVNGYRDDPHTKSYLETVNTYTNHQSMLQTNPQDVAKGLYDRGLIYNYANIENPGRSATGSVVEQDIDAKSYLEKIGIHVEGALDGAVLSDNQRAQLNSLIESKYKNETLQQQAVFNQYQNRLIGMRAQGRDIDPWHALPTYGGVVDHTPENADQYLGSSSGGTPQVKASDLMPNAPSMNATSAPAPKIASMHDVAETAAKSGRPTATVIQDLKKAGYVIQGEQ